MSRRIALMLGILLIAGGLLGASFTWSTMGEAKAHDQPIAQEDADNPGSTDDGQRSQAHEAMHEMMDAMMGDGFTERMHAAMPGPEAMMGDCATGMGGMIDDMQMDGMMGER